MSKNITISSEQLYETMQEIFKNLFEPILREKLARFEDDVRRMTRHHVDEVMEREFSFPALRSAVEKAVNQRIKVRVEVTDGN